MSLIQSAHFMHGHTALCAQGNGYVLSSVIGGHDCIGFLLSQLPGCHVSSGQHCASSLAAGPSPVASLYFTYWSRCRLMPLAHQFPGMLQLFQAM